MFWEKSRMIAFLKISEGELHPCFQITRDIGRDARVFALNLTAISNQLFLMTSRWVQTFFKGGLTDRILHNSPCLSSASIRRTIKWLWWNQARSMCSLMSSSISSLVSISGSDFVLWILWKECPRFGSLMSWSESSQGEGEMSREGGTDYDIDCYTTSFAQFSD